MLNSIEGIFRNGKVELLEPPPSHEDARVVVTFLPSRQAVDLRQRGINEGQAGDLRARLGSFTDEWDRPDMDVYDDL